MIWDKNVSSLGLFPRFILFFAFYPFFRVLSFFPRFIPFPRFILFSAFYPFFRVLSFFPRFIPFSAFYPFFRVLSLFPRFILFSAVYPFFRVLFLFPRFIPFSAFYPFFRVLSLFPRFIPFSASAIPYFRNSGSVFYPNPTELIHIGQVHTRYLNQGAMSLHLKWKVFANKYVVFHILQKKIILFW